MKTDKYALFVYCNFLVLLSTTVCFQNINKQIVNIAAENLTDYIFLVGITILNQRIIEKSSKSSLNSHVYFIGTILDFVRHNNFEKKCLFD